MGTALQSLEFSKVGAYDLGYNACVGLRPTPAFSVFFTSSTIIDQGGEVFGLTPFTGAMVPPKFHLRILLYARPDRASSTDGTQRHSETEPRKFRRP